MRCVSACWLAALLVFAVLTSPAVADAVGGDVESASEPNVVGDNNLAGEAGDGEAAAYDVAGYVAIKDAVAALEMSLSRGWKMTKATGREAVAQAMERGWWSLVEDLVAAGRQQGLDLSSTVHQNAAVIRRKLQSLAESLQQTKVSSGIAPAFQWAQSPDSVFLSVKFAHKWDTPATLGCEEDKVEMGEKGLLFEVSCKAKRKKFRLSLDLLKEIDAANSTWSMAAVGRAMFTLRKKESANWARLLQSQKKPGNMHVWWAMKEKYEAELKRLEDGQTKPKAASPSPSADASPSATATPTPPPTPTRSEFDVKRSELQRALTKKKKAADSALKTKLADIDSAARSKKRAIDDEATASKKAVDSEASANRTAAEQETRAEKDRLTAEFAAEVKKLHAELGASSESSEPQVPEPSDAADRAEL